MKRRANSKQQTTNNKKAEKQKSKKAKKQKANQSNRLLTLERRKNERESQLFSITQSQTTKYNELTITITISNN